MQQAESANLRQRALVLEYATIAWNVIEAFVAVIAGIAAASIALVGFGFDSAIEIAAASVVVAPRAISDLVVGGLPANAAAHATAWPVGVSIARDRP